MVKNGLCVENYIFFSHHSRGATVWNFMRPDKHF